MMNKKPFHLVLFFIVAVFFIWSVIKPAHYPIWFLEVGPSLIVLAIVTIYYNKVRLTTLSYTIIALLTILTFIGGHFTYDDVPFFDWLKETYDLKRNHYDRFGHFLKGLLFIVFRELLILKSPLSIGKCAQFLALNLVLSLAAFYEIVEWMAAKVSNRASHDFVGAQGDIWDAQWDMALTFLGSLIAWILLSRWHNRQLRKYNDIKEEEWS
jgi:putative membrane protein